MATPLPKPTTLKPPASSAAGQTVFQQPPTQAKKPVSPLPQAGVPAGGRPPIPPAAPVQLGGRNIPIPVNKPSVPGTQSSLGINPALAPKTTQPLAPLSATGTLKATPVAGRPPLTAAQPLKAPFTKQPFIAQILSNPKKSLLIALGALLSVFLIGFLLTRIFGGRSPSAQPGAAQSTQAAVLTYWGLWEPSAVLEEVIADYEQANPGIKIDYRVQSHKDYRERLQTAIASGNGPDIFRYHAAWVPMLATDLAVLPASVMTAADFQATFYPVAAEQLQVDGKIVGLPIMYDSLVLYYNQDILQTAGVGPPATWAELKQLANELTVPADKNTRSSTGIQRSGLAIGNASNVDHFSDILALLILQNGGDPGEPAFTEVRDALTFYTNFVTEDAIWNSTLPSSTVAFARGDAAMMFAPSWRAHEIMALNPSLKFGLAPLPQLSEEKIAWANYWAEGVNEKSQNKTAAWNFLKYLTSAEVMKKLYSAQAQVRTFGEPYSRQDLASELQADPYVGAILKDAPSASGWFMSSATHDNGLNDNIIDYYAAAVNAVLAGEEIDKVLVTLESGVKQELRQYSQSE